LLTLPQDQIFHRKIWRPSRFWREETFLVFTKRIIG
jgi:hypothetical protein